MLYCYEPTRDTSGFLLGRMTPGGDNGLLGCYASLKVKDAVIWQSWFKPDSPAGGKRRDISAGLPSYVGSYPVEVSCVCFNRFGWGPSRVGWVTMRLIDVP